MKPRILKKLLQFSILFTISINIWSRSLAKVFVPYFWFWSCLTCPWLKTTNFLQNKANRDYMSFDCIVFFSVFKSKIMYAFYLTENVLTLLFFLPAVKKWSVINTFSDMCIWKRGEKIHLSFLALITFFVK